MVSSYASSELLCLWVGKLVPASRFSDAEQVVRGPGAVLSSLLTSCSDAEFVFQIHTLLEQWLPPNC